MSPDPLTVVHITAQLRFGAGRYLVDTAIEQARGLKHRVRVCVSADVDENWRTDPKLVSELADHGIEVETIGDFFHRRPDLIQQSATHLNRVLEGIGRPAIVHAHTAMAAAAGYWAQPDALVATCHGWGAGRPASVDLEDSLAYQLCNSIITYSNHWAARLKHDLAVHDVRVILMGLDLVKYPQFPEKRPVKSTPFRIVTVCELTHRKGVDLLLDAMPMLWARFPSAELHILGNGDSADSLRKMAETIDAGKKRIFFHGMVANPYGQLNDFDLFVLASRSDNLPVVLLEAMLARLPIVATAVGGNPEVVSNAGCGEIVPPESAAALAEGIGCTLDKGRQEMISLGAKGEQFARSHLDVRKTAAELEEIYHDALNKS